MFGTKDTFEKGDNVVLHGNDSGRKLASTTVIDSAPCEKDTLLAMLKSHKYDYSPIKAFRSRANDNRKLKTSYSVKGTMFKVTY